MADKAPQKNNSMTGFKSDRHEDLVALVVSAVVVVFILFYMAFLTGPVLFKAPSDGKVLNIAVSENEQVRKGDILLTMEVSEKKVVNGQTEEEKVEKLVRSRMNGSIMKIAAVPGISVTKDKDLLMVVRPEKGTLP